MNKPWRKSESIKQSTEGRPGTADSFRPLRLVLWERYFVVHSRSEKFQNMFFVLKILHPRSTTNDE